MSGLKKHLYALTIANSEFAVVPDEIDRYEVLTIKPSISSAMFVASAGTAGTSAVVAAVINNKKPDWPRNVEFALAGSHANMTGTLVLNGRDQFGANITESLTFSKAANGGTAVGTKVFGWFDSGTLFYGTAVGNGTADVRFAVGTNLLLGLPVKIRNASDVVHLGMNAGTGPISYNGGTISGFVNTGMHAIRPAAAVDGTAAINVWVKPSYSYQNQKGVMADLRQSY